MKENLIKFIGLLFRGRQIFVGDDAKALIKQGKAKFVVVANDVSEASKTQIDNLINLHNVKCSYILTKDELGTAIGKSYVALIATKDMKIANKLEELTKEDDENGKR